MNACPPFSCTYRPSLSWVIEAREPGFTPAGCAEWLEGRLPRPVEDPEQWELDEA
jgi:hypothetical protein